MPAYALVCTRGRGARARECVRAGPRGRLAQVIYPLHSREENQTQLALASFPAKRESIASSYVNMPPAFVAIRQKRATLRHAINSCLKQGLVLFRNAACVCVAAVAAARGPDLFEVHAEHALHVLQHLQRLQDFFFFFSSFTFLERRAPEPRGELSSSRARSPSSKICDTWVSCGACATESAHVAHEQRSAHSQPA